MPYIHKDDRIVLQRGEKHEETAGELNYSITMLCNRYLRNHRQKYQTFNDIIGALEGAKLEMYRRLIGPYEDTKVQSNGDVYDV